MTYRDAILAVLRCAADKSDCAKIRFGAAALDEGGHILAIGYNHNPRPDPGWSCAASCAGGIRAGVRSGTCVERCYAVHAEQHALLLARLPIYEIAVAGWLPDGTLFDNGGGFYCTVCARLMASAGVAKVGIWADGRYKQISIDQAWGDSFRLAVK